MPTAEERESLLDFQGEDASLRDVEQKLRVLSAVPRPPFAESTPDFEAFGGNSADP